MYNKMNNRYNKKIITLIVVLISIIAGIFIVYAYGDFADPAAGNAIEVGSPSVFTVTSDGKVGIGTTTPGTKLHVFGGDGGNSASIKTETAQPSGSNVGLWMVSPTSNWFIGTNRGDIAGASDNLLFYTSGATKMVINNAGNVGIGTTDPKDKLHVKSGNFRVSDATDLKFLAINPSSIGGYNIRSTDDSLHLSTESSTGIYQNTMTIKGGNVGVGVSVTDPKEVLHVYGAERIDTDTTNIGKIRFYKSAEEGAIIQYNTNTVADGLVIGTVTDRPLSFNTKNLPRMTIDNFGFVQITQLKTASGNAVVCVNANGVLYRSTTGNCA